MADISKITLPSGTTYNIKDEVAREAIAGGVSFIVAWDGASTPVPANIPAGVVVTYQGTSYTGTLSAETTGEGDHAQAGAFYLVRSSTAVGVNDTYDEYVPVGTDGSKTWEKLGDTQIDLSDVVTDVSLSKQTATVIGSSATFTVTQPTIGLALGNTETTGSVPVASNVSVTTTKVKATASGTAVTASGDNVTALTGLGTPTTQNAVKSVTPTTKKLATTTVTGVSGSTTPNVIQGRTSQTTADGTGTASTTNTDWLKGVSVANETLTIGAATMDTQTTYSANAPTTITVPTAASSATTVATGATTSSGSGASIVTDVSVGDTIAAVTGYASPTTDTVIGTSSTFNVTQPTVALSADASAGAGSVTVATDANVTNSYLTATASGANTTWNSKDQKTVLTNATDVNVTKGS